jgi:acrylyl-CoA reductase (NADPH)
MRIGRLRLMTGLPDTLRAYVVDRQNDQFVRGLTTLRPDDLPPGEVVIGVEHSTVNYKDGLAAREEGRVVRSYPLVPGIDLAGTVVTSDDPQIPEGTQVIASGYELGVARHGGYAELARVPAGWVVPLPPGLTGSEAMAIGTAGFTAAMSVVALEERGVTPGDGPILVTGASGGLGRVAIDLLAGRGYEVWAATGKADEAERLREIGAADVIGRDEATADSPRPLESARWAGAVDSVGGPTMPYILRTLRPGAAVASCGNAGGPAFSTTVLPFILRGVAVLGMDSATVPIEARRELWRRLATDLRPRHLDDDVTEVDLDGVEAALDAIVAGRARGRWVVCVKS